MTELIRWLQARKSSHETNVLRFDECVYTTYTYKHVDEARGLPSTRHWIFQRGRAPYRPDSHGIPTGDLLGMPELHKEGNSSSADHVLQTISEEAEEEGAKPTATSTSTSSASPRKASGVMKYVPEVFFMEYGTVVIWGMSLSEEKRLLREIRRFEVERLATEDIESEDLNWYLADYSRIYNDVITLRRGSSYMTKLSLSHALAQSTKISFFESVIEDTIDTTKDVPRSIAESGKVGMPPTDIMKNIGHVRTVGKHLTAAIYSSHEHSLSGIGGRFAGNLLGAA
ncbi:sporulation protein Rmd1 [Malassezia pachydermatis]